ncbi:hypothetical protein BDV97DRAFT_76083 [Delphinella strobiligena]|nr:hypothetical protein BDV97DRAFT_76083 [Delphinella strobiligena]
MHGSVSIPNMTVTVIFGHQEAAATISGARKRLLFSPLESSALALWSPQASDGQHILSAPRVTDNHDDGTSLKISQGTSSAERSHRLLNVSIASGSMSPLNHLPMPALEDNSKSNVLPFSVLILNQMFHKNTSSPRSNFSRRNASQQEIASASSRFR